MPIYDIKSDLSKKLVFKKTFTSNGSQSSMVIDTADKEGVEFVFMCTSYTDGTYTFVLKETDSSDGSGATDISDAQLIPKSGAESAVSISSATAQGDILKSIGIVDTKRYIVITGTGASITSGASIQIIENSRPKYLPATQS